MFLIKKGCASLRSRTVQRCEPYNLCGTEAQVATDFIPKIVKSPPSHIWPCNECEEMTPFSMGAMYWVTPYIEGEVSHTSLTVTYASP